MAIKAKVSQKWGCALRHEPWPNAMDVETADKSFYKQTVYITEVHLMTAQTHNLSQRTQTPPTI